MSDLVKDQVDLMDKSVEIINRILDARRKLNLQMDQWDMKLLSKAFALLEKAMDLIVEISGRVVEI